MDSRLRRNDKKRVFIRVIRIIRGIRDPKFFFFFGRSRLCFSFFQNLRETFDAEWLQIEFHILYFERVEGQVNKPLLGRETL